MFAVCTLDPAYCECPAHKHGRNEMVPGCECWECTGGHGCEACHYNVCPTH